MITIFYYSSFVAYANIRIWHRLRLFLLYLLSWWACELHVLSYAMGKDSSTRKRAIQMETKRSGSKFLMGCGKTYLAAIGYRLGITLLCLLVLLPLCVLAAIVPLPASVDRGFAMIAALLLWMMICFVATLGYIAWMFAQRAQRLDAAFTPLGLHGQFYMLSGRSYQGTVNGRAVNVYLYKGPYLDIYIESALGTRVGISNADALVDFIGRSKQADPLSLLDSDLSSLRVYSADVTWAQALMDLPLIKSALLRLLAEPAAEQRFVRILPDAILFRIHYTQPQNAAAPASITALAVGAWFDDLLALLRVAESLPEPQERLESTELEHNARVNRKTINRKVALITLAVFAVLILCSLGLGGVVLVWALSTQ